jgi:hypothetical protein
MKRLSLAIKKISSNSFHPCTVSSGGIVAWGSTQGKHLKELEKKDEMTDKAYS